MKTNYYKPRVKRHPFQAFLAITIVLSSALVAFFVLLRSIADSNGSIQIFFQISFVVCWLLVVVFAHFSVMFFINRKEIFETIDIALEQKGTLVLEIDDKYYLLDNHEFGDANRYFVYNIIPSNARVHICDWHNLEPNCYNKSKLVSLEAFLEITKM